MRGALGGPGVLLRRLREVMAAPVSAQERLDRLVVLIAGNLVAEVCSVYVLREDGSLELYATEGLNRAAVHETSLRIGEGLVGLIAALALPLVLATAWFGLHRIDARHRALARWVWPLWMYVSISGVVVYLLLYQVYA